MTDPQRTSHCKILSLASPRPAAARRPLAVLSLIAGERAINLTELSRAIQADRNLCCRVTRAARREFGCPRLSVEQAIVLLGRERLAGQLLRLARTYRNPAAANRRQPETFQGEAE